jgi:heme/copper-type cytochrome/quinol oxidase subunit 2
MTIIRLGWRALLRQLVGRIITDVADWFISVGSIWIPIGAVCLIFGTEEMGKDSPDWFTIWTMFVLAIVLFVVGFIAMSSAYKRLRSDENARRKDQVEDNAKFAVLISEIRGLREDLNR